MKLFKFLPVFCLLIYSFVVFRPFFFEGKLPIPADTIVGLYHPWRDFFVKDYPNGVTFKNFLITDPVRQHYPWRQLGSKWNPYSSAGTPLLANIQAAHFYPLNFLPWDWQVVLQVILGGVFMVLYLRHLKLRPEAQALGTIAWVGSGFFVAWLEWNTLVQVAIWLPLTLLAIDENWWWLLVLALTCSFFAGHLQIWFYVFLLALAYAFFYRKINFKFILSLVLVFLLTSSQWRPMVTLFQEGVRATTVNPDWFLPWQNLAQFIAPDFFGNPATLNYFGRWNYGEFVGYVGIGPLVFAFFALGTRNIFWIGVLALSLLFSLPNGLSQLPLQIVQPTRLMVLIDFSLAMLAAFGLDAFLSQKRRVWQSTILLAILATLWLVAWKLGLAVSQKNLVLPTILIIVASVLVLKPVKLSTLFLLGLTVFDLARFATKFEAFSPKEYLFPQTKIIDFLQEKSKQEVFRVVALDDRVFPPNFSTAYKIQMPSGYDSIFLKRYENLLSKIEGVESFNRIVVPKNYHSPWFPLLQVKYLLTFDTLKDPDYDLVLEEGTTKVYENKKVLPRAFFQDRQNGIAKIVKYSEDEVVIQTQNSQNDNLILLDVFYPDWKAEIDGRPTKIYPAFDTFRQIFVPAGPHAVSFKI